MKFDLPKYCYCCHGIVKAGREMYRVEGNHANGVHLFQCENCENPPKQVNKRTIKIKRK